MFLSQNPLPQALGPSPIAACSCLAVVPCPEFPFGMIPGSQPGLAAPGADRRCWPCSGETLGPHRYRGITVTRACASPPSISGFSMVRHQLRVPRGCFGGSSFVLDLLRGCVPGREAKAPSALPGEERGGKERKAFGAPREVSEVDLFPKCRLAGVCRDSPARRRILLPAGSEGCPRAIPCARRSLAACPPFAWEGSCAFLRCHSFFRKD